MKTTKDKHVVMAADFAGYPLKEAVKQHLINKGWTVEDLTPDQKIGYEIVLRACRAPLTMIAEGMVHSMDFQFLFDSSRKLFSIGYRVTEGLLDPSTYDLLASEARLTSFMAIAGVLTVAK